MRQVLIVWMILAVSLCAATILPKRSVKTSGPVIDLVYRQNLVWGATASGEILAIDTDGKIRKTYRLPKRTDFMGERQPQGAFSLDVSPDGKVIAVGAEEGAIYLVRENKLYRSAFSTQAVIKKIAFVDNEHLLIALLSNEIILFDINKNRILRSRSGGSFPLSDMALNDQRNVAALCGEAGIVTLIDPLSLKVLRILQGGNVDNIYKIDYKNGKILTAGQDRRAIVYDQAGRQTGRFDGRFLIYSAALSPDASIGAIAMDEDNTLSLYRIAQGQLITKAKGHGATLNRIIFIDHRRFVSSADENKILLWELP